MNIIPDNDIERIRALHRYKILDTPPEHAFDNVAKLATQIFNVPISLISLVDAENVFFKANIGMGNARTTSRGVSLCSLAVLKSEVTVFEDAPEEPCLLANPNVAGSFGLKFYAGAPLTTHDGFLIGTLCVIDKKPRKFSAEDQEILQGLAKIVMDEIELRLSAINETTKLQSINEDLSAINEEMTAANEELNATNEELAVSQNNLSLTYYQLSESNERLELALNAGKLGSYDLNLDTGVMFCTAQCKMNFGISLDASFHLHDLINAILPEYRDYVQAQIDNARKYNTLYVAEYEILWPDGSKHWISTSGKTSVDRVSGANRLIGVTLNITERKEFEKRKDDFLGIASHELKTPITSLKANLQMLNRIKNTPENPLFVRLIESSNRSMEKLTSIVDDLLNMHQFNEGHLRLNKTSFTIVEMLELCCNHVRINGKYELVIEGDRNLEVFADEHRIDQVVVNFVNNAVKYAPDSRDIVLAISKEGDHARISVTDLGPGIPKNQQQHLFERYWRADHSGSKYSGLGIGLYICAEIIKQHGGQIGVDSEVGKGSTFWFKIPMA